MSELLKQLEGAAKELDTLVEMYVRNDSPTRAADCTAKAASVREVVALLSPSGAPAGLVEAATALSRGATERLLELEGQEGTVNVWLVKPDALHTLRMALTAVHAQPEAVAVPVSLARLWLLNKGATEGPYARPDDHRAYQRTSDDLAALFAVAVAASALAEKGDTPK